MEEFESALKKEFKDFGKPHLVQNIAVVGSNHGCGATHIAISLVCSLNYLGYRAVYIEKNTFGDLQGSLPFLHGSSEINGHIYYKHFTGIPAYGQGIVLTTLPDAIKVYDYGCSYPSPESLASDITLFICGGAIWHRNKVADNYLNISSHNPHVIAIGNLCSTSQAKSLARLLKARIYSFPFDSNPFDVSKDKASFFRQLLSEKGSVRLSFGKRKGLLAHRE